MRRLALAFLLACTCARISAQGAAAQDPAPPAVERLADWPALEKTLREQVTTDITRLRKARTPEMADQARDALKLVGAAIAPELLPILGKETDEDALSRVRSVLLAITGAAHTRCLARHFEDKSAAVRVFALERAAAFPDPGIREAAERAYAKAKEARAKGKADASEVYAAALALTSSGSSAGLELLFERSLKDWGTQGAPIRIALEAVRGPEASGLALERLARGDRNAQISALNLLGGCGVPELCNLPIKPFLDSEDNGLRIAAINALRGIVDHEPPLDKLSVFDAIELAKKWKARL
jgi:hypothetical protein